MENNLRKLRGSRSQADIASLVGITKAHYGYIENGNRVGEFKIFAYYRGPNGLLTATGTTCSEGRTVAADFKVLPAGTRIYIDGVGERTVEDCGVSGRTLDLFIASRQACLDWGKQYREVWVIE